MPHRVLVVDDDLIMHEVLQRYLGRNGYEMINACNGREAIALATRELPELIILDVMMPEMGGLSALRQLKETEATKAIPVIVLSVNADRETRLESEFSGATAFLTKPFSPAQLLAEVRRLLPGTKPDDAAGNPRK